MTAEKVSSSIIAAQSASTSSGAELISGKHSDGIYARILGLRLQQLRSNSADITSQIAQLEDERQQALQEEAQEEARVAAENARNRTAQQTRQTQQAQQTQQTQQTQQAQQTQTT